eukprot:13859-Pelagococcus_subviridis.AAC.3
MTISRNHTLQRVPVAPVPALDRIFTWIASLVPCLATLCSIGKIIFHSPGYTTPTEHQLNRALAESTKGLVSGIPSGEEAYLADATSASPPGLTCASQRISEAAAVYCRYRCANNPSAGLDVHPVHFACHPTRDLRWQPSTASHCMRPVEQRRAHLCDFSSQLIFIYGSNNLSILSKGVGNGVPGPR